MSPKKYIFFTYIINILENGENPEKVSLEFLRDCVMLWNKKARTGSTLVQFVNVVRKNNIYILKNLLQQRLDGTEAVSCFKKVS